MSCPLCSSENVRRLLDKPAAEIFTGGYSPGQKPRKLPCRLDQCGDCGHVFQPMDETLQDALRTIYEGPLAQASTSTGVGQWGKARADRAYGFARPETPPARVLEIGSPNGYMLELFRKNGAQLTVGIDPSLPDNSDQDGVRLIKGFFPDGLDGLGPFDCVVAFNVVEHIEDVRAFLNSLREVMVHGGTLAFSTPNCQLQMEQGDPAVFMHEHVHYFTAPTIIRMLHSAGFIEHSICMEADNIYVQAVKSNCAPTTDESILSWDGYATKLEAALDRFTSLFAPGRTILAHGACNSLNNILHWTAIDQDALMLTDNDPNKHGKYIAGSLVSPRERIDLASMNAVVILPFAFSGPIKDGYLKAGYHGSFVLLTESLQ